MAAPLSAQRKLGLAAGIFLLLCAALWAYMLRAGADDADFKSGLPVEKLVIRSPAGKEHAFNVEIAVKPMDMEVGLMFRKQMGRDHGMLFELNEDKEVTFWMKNTLIPLDMIFVAKDGKIINIHRRARPEDLRPIPSRGAVTGVIEINGGEAEELGIGIGDSVIHPYFSQPAGKKR